MNVLDMVILATLLFGGYQGFRKGFLLEAISVAAFIIGIIGAFKLLHWGISLLDAHFEINGVFLPYISFILIFIGIIVLINVLGKLVKKVVDMTLLGSLDKLAGGILSVLKWSFGISVILWLSNSVGLKLLDTLGQESLLLVYIEPIAPNVINALSMVMPFAKDLFEMIKEMLQSASAN